MTTDEFFDAVDGTDDYTNFSFDDEVGEGDLDSGGIVTRPGWYHLEVTDVVPELDTRNRKNEPKAPGIRFDLTVMKSVDGQSPAGDKVFHRIYIASKDGNEEASRKCRMMCYRWAIACGAARHEGNRVIDVTTGKNVDLDTYMRCKGQQIIAEVEIEQQENRKPQARIPYSRAFRPDDPDVSQVPKDEAALELIGIGSGGGPSPDASGIGEPIDDPDL